MAQGMIELPPELPFVIDAQQRTSLASPTVPERTPNQGKAAFARSSSVSGCSTARAFGPTTVKRPRSLVTLRSCTLPSPGRSLVRSSKFQRSARGVEIR